MKLFNSKSILDCTESEIEQHNQECSTIIKKLHKYDDYDCAVIYKYFDKSNIEKEPVIKQCNLYDCLDMVQLTFICYGSEYVLNNQVYLVTTGIQIRPYDKKKNYIYLNLH